MNEIKLFENPEFGQVRVLEQEGEPWFVGKDVAAVLGYENPTKAIRDHVDDEDKKVGVQNVTPSVIDSLGREQYPTWINESGLYSLILRSQLPEAKAFKRWITHEVIPSIRKTGGYIQGQEQMSDEEIIANAVKVANRILEEREKRIAALEQEKALMAPKADYFDALVDKNLLTNFRDAAKEIGVTQTELIKFCEQQGYIYRDANGSIRPYAQYAKPDGYFALKDYQTEHHAGVQTLLTPKGKEACRLMLQSRLIQL